MASDKLSSELGRLYSSMGSANSWKALVGRMTDWAKQLEAIAAGTGQIAQGPMTGQDVLRKLGEAMAEFDDPALGYHHTQHLVGTVVQKDIAGADVNLNVAVVVSRHPKHPFDVLDEREREIMEKGIRAFVGQLIDATAIPPCSVSENEVMRLLKQHLPEFVPGAATVAPTEGEGAHGAGPGKTENR